MAKAKKVTKKKQPKRRAKKPAKKKSAKKPAKPAKKPAKTDAGAEREAAALLKAYADGNVDNAWDVIFDMFELDKKLSKASKLRPEFDQMYEDIEKICRESPGGGGDDVGPVEN